MRKSTAAVLAIGSAFALTAAAATAISVTGPFDPAAGSAAATTCDIGDTTLDSLTDGTDLLGFTLTTTIDTTNDTGCANADIWLRVDYTDTLDITQSLYATLPAAGDYTNGTDLALDADFSTDLDLTTPAANLPLADETITNTTVLVTTTPPTNFAPVIEACYDGLGGLFDVSALTGPINTLGNLVIYLSIGGTCTDPLPNGSDYGIVKASGSTRAAELCSAIGAALTPELNGSFGDYWPGAPTDWWVCTTLFN